MCFHCRGKSPFLFFLAFYLQRRICCLYFSGPNCKTQVVKLLFLVLVRADLSRFQQVSPNLNVSSKTDIKYGYMFFSIILCKIFPLRGKMTHMMHVNSNGM